MSRIWQFAAGDTNRDYVDILLKWSVIAMGPGNLGPWSERESEYRESLKGKKGKFLDLKRFCEEVESGDIIVLRLGTKEICAVGRVEDGRYKWFDDFGDIDGWDLQHVKRVQWLWKPKERNLKAYEKQHGDLRFAWGSVTHEVDEKSDLGRFVFGKAQSSHSHDEVPSLPPSCLDRQRHNCLEPNKIAENLYDRGIVPTTVNNLMSSMRELIQIADWYKRSGQPPSEYETVAYLIIPLLRALGWSPQQVAVEWDNIDVAIFDTPTRTDGGLVAVIEAKKLETSFLTARVQAEKYAKKKNRKKCNRLILTNGINYAIHVRNDENLTFPVEPSAHLNILRMLDGYPILGKNCKGASEALYLMSSRWRPNS